jgi:hypothetical protein
MLKPFRNADGKAGAPPEAGFSRTDTDRQPHSAPRGGDRGIGIQSHQYADGPIRCRARFYLSK